VPGIYQDTSAGLFTIIEDVNKTFLERVMAPGTGLLMKPEQLGGGIRSLGESWAQYAPKLRPDRDATAHEQQRVMEFSRLISQPDVALFREKLGTYLDVDAFLRFIFVNAFIGNWDSYLTGGHNFYFYLDPSDDRFRFVPWDMDLSLSRGGFGGAAIRIVRADGTVVNGVGNAVTVVNGNTFTFVNGTATVNGAEMGGARAPAMPGTDIMAPGNRSQMLITKVLDDPAWAERYREIIRELSTTVFSAAELTKLMDALEGVNKGAPNSPREFLLGRAKVLQDLIASWEK
jgi:spore coat protein CotH